MLWPRFEYILELNIHSVLHTDPQRLGSIDVRPHYVSVVIPNGKIGVGKYLGLVYMKLFTCLVVFKSSETTINENNTNSNDDNNNDNTGWSKKKEKETHF